MHTPQKTFTLVLLLLLCSGCTQAIPHPTAVVTRHRAASPATAVAPSRTPLPTATRQPAARLTATSTPKPLPPQATPLPQTEEALLIVPPLNGVLYTQRNHEIIAIDLKTFAERSLGLYAETFRISPDGKRVALVSNGALTIASTDGQNPRQLASEANDDFSWAPDSQALAFVRAPESTQWHCPAEAEVWVVELSNNGTRRIDTGCNPTWSPDGLRLAYVSPYDFLQQARGGAPPNRLYLVNRYGQNRWSPLQAGTGFALASGNDYFYRRFLYQPFWSVDGSNVFVLAYVCPEWVLSTVETLEQVDSYQGTARTVAVLYSMGPIQPSPNRQHIAYDACSECGFGVLGIDAFPSQDHPCEDYEWCHDTDLVLQNARQVTIEHVWEASWSPDGQFLMGVYCPDELTSRCYWETGLAEIRLIDPQTGLISAPLFGGIDPYANIEWRP